MKGSKPFIHRFTTNRGFYVYDVNTNRILNLEKSVFDYLGNRNSTSSADDAGTVEHLVANGFLSSDTIEEIVHPDDEYLEYVLSRKLGMLCLQVTQNCNLRCEYCAYSGIYRNRTHSNRRMNWETAKKGIDFYIGHSSDSNEMTFAFYGGEPFLEFNLIKKCCEYIKTSLTGKPYNVFITTNGTMLNDEILVFLQEYRVHLTISLDGPSEIHNRNRKFPGNNRGSFDTIIKLLESIKTRNPEYLENISFCATVDERNDFSCINSFFMNYETVKDRFTMFNSINPHDLVAGKVYASEYFHIKREYEVFKMFMSKINRLDEKHVSPLVAFDFNRMRQKIHQKRTPELKLSGKRHPAGPCIPGATRLFMNADGTFYPCERVSETSEIMKIGDVDTGFRLDKINYLLNIGKITENACTQCEEVKYTAEEMLKNYCTLREFGCDFDG
jgi:uncharacterized protein